MKSVSDFPIGSIVRLVSGGPEMTVAAHMAYSHLVPIEKWLWNNDPLQVVWCDYASDDNVIRRWSGYPDCIELVETHVAK